MLSSFSFFGLFKSLPPFVSHKRGFSGLENPKKQKKQKKMPKNLFVLNIVRTFVAQFKTVLLESLYHWVGWVSG